MSEYCKNCKEMQDEIDRLRRVIKDARGLLVGWALDVTDYFTDNDDLKYALKKLDDEIANNEKKDD